jgi:hypothetical protein
MDVFAHIVFMELKIGVSKQVLDVFEVTRDEVVHAKNPKTVFYKTITEV